MKERLPYWIRYVRYLLKCLWYYILFPTDIKNNS